MSNWKKIMKTKIEKDAVGEYAEFYLNDLDEQIAKARLEAIKNCVEIAEKVYDKLLDDDPDEFEEKLANQEYGYEPDYHDMLESGALKVKEALEAYLSKKLKK